MSYLPLCTAILAISIPWRLAPVPKPRPGPIPRRLEQERPEKSHRKRLSGRVLGKDGKPWAQAEVLLFSRPVPTREELGNGDLQRVISDKRGRFRAQILPGRPYSVWARDLTSRSVSAVVEDVYAGKNITIKRQARKHPAFRLVLKPGKGYEARAPFSVRLVTQTANFQSYDLQLGEDLEADLPLVPGRHFWLEVYGKDAAPLFIGKYSSSSGLGRSPRRSTGPLGEISRMISGLAERFESSLDRLKAAKGKKTKGKAPAKADTRRIILRLPTLSKLKVHVNDDNNKPLAGARIWFRSMLYSPLQSDNFWQDKVALRSKWLLLGESKEDGSCEVMIAQSQGTTNAFNSKQFSFYAEADGHAIQRANYENPWTGKRSQSVNFGFGGAGGAKKKEKKKKTDGIQFELVKGSSVKGRVWLEDGKPAANLPLLLEFRFVHEDEQKLYYDRLRYQQLGLRTDIDGRFACQGLPTGVPFLLMVGLDERLAKQMRLGKDGQSLPVPKIILARSDSCKKEHDLGDLNLTKLRRVDFSLHHADGRPARARVRLMPKMKRDQGGVFFFGMYGSYSTSRTLLADYYSNRRGKLSVLIAEGDYELFALTTEHEYYADTFSSKDIQQEQELALKKMAVLQGSVKNSKGTPLPRAKLRCSSWSMGAGSSFSPEIQQLNNKAFQIETDKDGRFKTWFIPLPQVSYQVTASWFSRKNYQSTDKLRVGTESITDAELTIDAPDPGGSRKRKK